MTKARERLERAVSMKEKAQLVEAIRQVLQDIPADDNGQFDVGALLADAFEEAGYSLECHQQGIKGTVIMATPI